MSRYNGMFSRLASSNAGAVVPFTVLGDPSPNDSLAIADAFVAGGADAIELGIPFSDPLADGPVIQAAAGRALAAGVSLEICFELLSEIRARHSDLPIGLLVYSNLVTHDRPDRFFARAARAGADSVLIADIPSVEIEPYARLAIAAGIDPVLIVPPNASADCLQRVAELGRGFTYLQGRPGVTGVTTAMQRPSVQLIGELRKSKAPPPLVGFGISSVEHVAIALQSGAKGVIVGSALVQIVEEFERQPDATCDRLVKKVAEFKAATRT